MAAKGLRRLQGLLVQGLVGRGDPGVRGRWQAVRWKAAWEGLWPVAIEPGLLLSSFLQAGPSPPCKVSHQVLTAWTVELTQLSSPETFCSLQGLFTVSQASSGKDIPKVEIKSNLPRPCGTGGRGVQKPRSSDSFSPPCPPSCESCQYPPYPNPFQIFTATFHPLGGFDLFWVLGCVKVAGIMVSWSLFFCFIIVIVGKKK